MIVEFNSGWIIEMIQPYLKRESPCPWIYEFFYDSIYLHRFRFMYPEFSPETKERLEQIVNGLISDCLSEATWSLGWNYCYFPDVCMAGEKQEICLNISFAMDNHTTPAPPPKTLVHELEEMRRENNLRQIRRLDPHHLDEDLLVSTMTNLEQHKVISANDFEDEYDKLLDSMSNLAVSQQQRASYVMS